MLDRLGIILGNRYADSDLQDQYGHLPPSFLPFGLHSLYLAQVTALGAVADRVVLVIPPDFQVGTYDRRALRQLGCQCVAAPVAACPVQTLHAIRGSLGECNSIVVLEGDAVPADACDIEQDESRSACFDLTNPAAFLHGEDDPSLRPSQARVPMQRGDLKRYYDAKIRSVTKRFFNSISIEGDWVRKRASDQARIAFETAWFGQAPLSLRHHLPEYQPSEDGASYRTGILRLPLLSELLIGAGSAAPWPEVLARCTDFLERCHATTPPAPSDTKTIATDFHRSLIRNKSFSRIDETCRQLHLDPAAEWRVNGRRYPSLLQTVETLIDLVPPSCPEDIGMLHGDFHFGNIFFDRREDRIKVIDPRGSVDGITPCAFGDIRYDMAKLAHSAIGLYDLIMGGHCRTDRTGQTELQFDFDLARAANLGRLQSAFLDMRVVGRSFADSDVAALTALLFLTMPPLHKDRPDRQMAMLANGFRLADTLLAAPTTRLGAPPARVALCARSV